MPQIPEYADQNRVQTQAIPGVRVMTDEPGGLEAFGGGASAQALNTATIGAFGTVEKLAEQQKYQADQAAHLQADTALSEAQTKIQLQVAGMKGQDAINAPQFAREQWDKAYEDVSGTLNNDAQREALAKSSAARWNELNKATMVHTNAEQNNFLDQNAQSSIDQSRKAAVIYAGDPEIVAENAKRVQSVVDQLAQRKGWGTTEGAPGYEIYKDQLDKSLSPLHHDVVEALLNVGQDQGAKDYLEKNKTQMSPNDLFNAQAAITNQMVVADGNNLFKEVLNRPGLKFTDGTLDVEKVKDSVTLPDNISDIKRQALTNFIEAKAKDFNQYKNLKDLSLNRAFMNQVYQARKDGVPLSDAMKYATHYGVDQSDQATKAYAIGQIYAPPSQSDPYTFMPLWEETQKGEGSRQAIDQAFKAGKINQTDWKDLWEADFKAKTEGVSPGFKDVNERIKLLADQQFGSDTSAKNNFLYDVHADGKNKTPDELFKLANDKIVKDPSTGMFSFTQDRKYESNIKQSDAEALAKGQVFSDVGSEQTKAIGAAMSKSTGKPWGLTDIDQFSKAMGGYNNIKVGTPVNNAIQSLKNNNEEVSVKNINYLLNKFPDGKWTK